jgi:hypothetical protein
MLVGLLIFIRHLQRKLEFIIQNRSKYPQNYEFLREKPIIYVGKNSESNTTVSSTIAQGEKSRYFPLYCSYSRSLREARGTLAYLDFTQYYDAMYWLHKGLMN